MWPRRNKRQIYKFWNGSRRQSVDPLLVMRAFDTDPKFRMDVHPTMMEDGDIDSMTITLLAIRRAFGVKAWTEAQPGLTELETLALYQNFCVYMIELKKNISPSPILPDFTEPTSESSITNVMWGSGLTEIERQRERQREYDEQSNPSCLPCSEDPEPMRNGVSI